MAAECARTDLAASLFAFRAVAHFSQLAHRTNVAVRGSGVEIWASTLG